jgi:hypothetical protein
MNGWKMVGSGRGCLGLGSGRNLGSGGVGGGGSVAAQDLAPGSGGPDRSVGQEFDFPSPPVNADIMVELAEQNAVLDAGRAAVLLPPDMMHVTIGRALVAAAGPGALLVAGDDGPPDRLGNVIGVALVCVLYQ